MKVIKILLIVLVVSSLTACGCKKKEEKDKNNDNTIIVTEKDVIKDQVFDGLQFKQTSLVVTGRRSNLVSEVTNNTGEDYYLNVFYITVKDKSGNVITTLPGYVGSVIKNGETKTINSNIDIDLSNAYSIEYSVKK